MNKCREFRRLFVEAAYDELTSEQKKAFKDHLDICPKCSGAFDDFAATLKTMSQRKRIGPDPDFWAEYWDRLSPQLETPTRKPSSKKERRPWIPELFQLPRWAYQTAAAVAILVIGIFIGKMMLGPSPAEKVVSQLTARKEVSPELVSYQTRADRYLEKSKVLLLGIVNFDPETEDPIALDFPRKQQISQDLIQEADVLKKGLTKYGAQDRLVELVSDLEVILLQIANLEKEHDLSAIDMVKSGVDRKGILLKINIEEMKQAASQSNEKTSRMSI